MLEAIQNFIAYHYEDLSKLDTDVILLVILLVNVYIVYDAISEFITASRKKAGIGKKSIPVSVDRAKNIATKEYISDIQGISGRPDAVLVEKGFFIPVEYKPLSKKLHDRHIAQILIYMRLVEEFEGKKPPYGYLILGPKRRRVRIMNTPEKQKWIDGMLGEMRELLLGAAPRATPSVSKCARCDVRESCKFKV